MDIELKNITKIFPSRKRAGSDVVAVDGMSFVIPDGALVGLLGPSGCGKSTVLNLISGLLEPTKGNIFFGGEDVTKLPAMSRGVGMVFQSYALYPHLTARENIRFPLENFKGDAKLTRDEMDKRVDDAARLVEITELLDRKPKELSGGQQQRVAIARAVVKLPRVLLLDEPLSNLDARLRLQTREEIRRIQRQTGITTVFVTHDQEEAMSICDTIVVIKNGAVHQIGAPQDVYDDPRDLFVAKFLGTPPINIFKGRIAGGSLFIGSEKISDKTYPAEGEVTVAIRPEGFVPDENGALTLNVSRVEVMGRDVTVVSTHPDFEGEQIRSIIDADDVSDRSAHTGKFNIKPNKLFVFDSDGGRIEAK